VFGFPVKKKIDEIGQQQKKSYNVKLFFLQRNMEKF
jgi:hypothetical protein